MQKHVNLVDLVKSFPTNILLQNMASIQKRTSPIKFEHLAEKSEKGSISNLSTKVPTDMTTVFPPASFGADLVLVSSDRHGNRIFSCIIRCRPVFRTFSSASDLTIFLIPAEKGVSCNV